VLGFEWAVKAFILWLVEVPVFCIICKHKAKGVNLKRKQTKRPMDFRART
jgi:hypothetical protein